MAKTVHAFCPVCGHHVECKEVVEGRFQRVVCTRCQYKVSEKKAAAPAPAAGPPAGGPFEHVILAEDTATVREPLAEALREQGVVRQIAGVADGFEFLVAWQRAVDAGHAVDLVILDLNMPLLDGVNAAIAMRAIERAAGRARAPILFYTSSGLDEAFGRALQYLAPARHLLKSTDGGGGQMATQVAQAVVDWRPRAS